MKKIMFNDNYGLTEAVLSGRKTMTRRLANIPKEWHGQWVGGVAPRRDFPTLFLYDGDGALMYDHHTGECGQIIPRYKIGELVAIAQSYSTIAEDNHDWLSLRLAANERDIYDLQYRHGWRNKQGVRSYYCPHRICITNVKVERLQDISDEDCRREGIVPVTWRQYMKQDLDDLSPQKYQEHLVWTLPKFEEGILNPWAESEPNEYMAESPQIAFAVLIFKLMGREVWDDNPYVFAYEFELVK